MSRFTKFSWILMAIALSGLAACSGGTPTTDPSLAYTQIWRTVEAAQTQTGLAVSPTPSVTDTPLFTLTPHATKTPLITNTPLSGIPSMTAFTISTPTVRASTQSASCDNMLGVSDVTYPDGSEIPARAVFIKTWSVKNLGPCTWDKNYRLAFGWGGAGTSWNTTPSSYLTAVVLPGETVEISVSLTAPAAPGNYAAAFRLQNGQGYNFGPAQTVVIVVK